MLLDLATNSRSVKKSAGDKWSRSLLKTISWRVIGTLDTILISWMLTGELTTAFTIGSVEVVTKMILYFFHERAWNKIPSSK